jgi:hypothetical protein
MPEHLIPEVHSGQIYTVSTATQALGLAPSCLRREIRLRRLRVSKRAGKYFILGTWLLEWLQTGEVKPGRPEMAETGVAGGVS